MITNRTMAMARIFSLFLLLLFLLFTVDEIRNNFDNLVFVDVIFFVGS